MHGPQRRRRGGVQLRLPVLVPHVHRGTEGKKYVRTCCEYGVIGKRIIQIATKPEPRSFI